MKVRRVDYYPDDFLVGASRLSCEEKGAYWVVCSLIYSHGTPIPDDDTWIAKQAGCSTRRWQALKARLLAVGKVEMVDGFITNKRCESELERAMNRTASARINGHLGGRPSAPVAPLDTHEKTTAAIHINGVAKAPGSDPPEAIIHQSSTINHQTTKKRTPPPAVAGFDDFWAECPLKVGKAPALKAFPKALEKPGVTLDLLKARMVAYREHHAAKGTDPKFLAHPATWLNNERWNDELPSAASPPKPVGKSLKVLEAEEFDRRWRSGRTDPAN